MLKNVACSSNNTQKLDAENGGKNKIKYGTENIVYILDIDNLMSRAEEFEINYKNIKYRCLNLFLVLFLIMVN